ncbi:MAG: V-type ATPase subunit subunit G family protein [Nitrospira sp.]|nr:V-type ATPase subunit subunit G family protein [Nitrospira sp.]
MSEPSDQKSPEILIQIQAAEQKVENMLRAAQQDAAAILDKARAQAETLLRGTRRRLEERKKAVEAAGTAEAEREAEQLLTNARAKAGDLKGRCMRRMDEAVGLVLKRILPSPLISDSQSAVGRNQNALKADG